jgi:hypothetical protein
MKNFIVTFCAAACVFALSACSKQTATPTPAQIVEAQLQKVINANGITRVVIVSYSAVFPNSFPSSTGISFSFSNGFITVSGYPQSFNLSYVKAYDIENVIISDNAQTSYASQALVLYID